MATESRMMSEMWLLTSCLSSANAFFCSAKSVGVRKMIRSRMAFQSLRSCLSRASEKLPSVSM